MAASYDHRKAATALLSVWLRAVASLYVTIFACALIFFSSAPAGAQTRQFAYVSNGSTVAGYVLDPGTGALTAIPAAPVVPRAAPGEMVLHPTGRFLYAISASNTVTGFSINQTTGALTELASSPYSADGSSTPKGIAIDKTGRYVLVAGASLIDDSSGSVSTYAVNQITGELTPLPTTFPLQLSPVGFVWSFVFNAFYYYGNYRPPLGTLVAAGGGFGIDPLSGTLTSDLRMGGVVGSIARTLAISPKGGYLFAGHGQYVGSIDSWVLSGPSFPSNSNLGINLFPTKMIVDAEEKFLYAVINQPLIHGYSINATTGVLTELPFSPFIGIDGGLITGSADPSGPFLYVPTGTGLKGYRIGSNGSLTPIPGSPVPAGASMVIARAPGQPVTGPIPVLSSSSMAFGQIDVGSTSPAQQIGLGNIGDRVVAITSIAIDPPTDFTQTNTTCPANLQPDARCTISVTFRPFSEGSKSATLSVISNGPTQTANLSGFGFVPPPPAPAVTLDRTNVDFPGVPVGSTSQGPPVKVTNTGQAPVVFSSMSITGPNLNDFSLQSNTCTASVPVNGNCTLTAAFKPLGVGFRSANLQIASNAPGSPHTVFLRGNGNRPPFTVGPPAGAPPDATTVSVTAGQTAQYSLQLAPDPDSIATVTVTLSCSGAPAGATCTVPPLVTSTNGNITPFTVTVTTTARAGAIPPASWPTFPPLDGLLTIVSALLGAAAVVLFAPYLVEGRLRLVGRLARYPWPYAALAITMSAALAIAACGGGYSSPPSSPASVSVSVTPATAAVPVGRTQNFTATVQNDATYNRGVTWTLSGSGCSAGACGTLSSITTTSVTYTAPPSPPNPATITLMAASISDVAKVGTATITIAASSAGTPPGTFTIMLTATSGSTIQQLPLTLIVR